MCWKWSLGGSVPHYQSVILVFRKEFWCFDFKFGFHFQTSKRHTVAGRIWDRERALGLVLKLLSENLHCRSGTLSLVSTHVMTWGTTWPKPWKSERRKTFVENKSKSLVTGMACPHIPSQYILSTPIFPHIASGQWFSTAGDLLLEGIFQHLEPFCLSPEGYCYWLVLCSQWCAEHLTMYKTVPGLPQIIIWFIVSIVVRPKTLLLLFYFSGKSISGVIKVREN